MPRFDEVARLRELGKRLVALKKRRQDWNSVNYGILEEVSIEQSLRNAFPWLLEVAGCFQPGDAALMGEILLLHREFEKDYPDENPGWSDLFARMEKAAKIMEEKE